MNISDFAYGTEKMIDPMLVGKTHYMQTRLCKLPKFIQRRIITSATKKTKEMGFVVEPYAFFLFYEIKDPASVQKYLPADYRPAKSCAFVGDTPRYYGIVSIFRLHTSTFWGARAEIYLTTENIKTGQLSWVILDYVSDTISYDYRHGLRSPDASHAVVTTTCEGHFLAELKHHDRHRCIICEADLTHATSRELDEKLWIEGNTSIAYGEELAGNDTGDLFSLTFLPREMKTAWTIPAKDVHIKKLVWFPEMTNTELAGAVCFPFAQHMLSDRPGVSTHYGSKSALEKAANSVHFKET